MEESLVSSSFTLQVDNSNIPHLSEAAKWAKFLSIVGFIICGLMVLGGLLVSTIFSTFKNQFDSELGSMGSLGSAIFMVWFIIIALIYFFPTFYLYNFASKMQTAIRTNDQETLNNSFKNLKSCFKFFGVTLIIVLCLYAVTIIFSIVAGLGLS
ncbi:MAG: hypothetical protein JST21_00615 [Bacteroidetes bacterium]|nr:hypothetical protein [Bacteroidota bacterium]